VPLDAGSIPATSTRGGPCVSYSNLGDQAGAGTRLADDVQQKVVLAPRDRFSTSVEGRRFLCGTQKAVHVELLPIKRRAASSRSS